MPLYDYKCRDHGLFQELAMVSDSAQPQPCPQCDSPSARVIVLTPALLGLDPAQREARERSDRSRHEPLFSTPEQRAEAQERHQHRHGPGCGCGDGAVSQPQVFYTADGKKWFPSARPWMISH
ncbi:zinc ribbon domain-containing protein [Leptolyngbya sp. KIOST-1]|uniref:zinc ribbon domain-containing protein n=1 Tax=Leptolyngbya sp. KIOST-1 TaxID=1229172 RepID=UPI00056D6F24|nr:zinc ribbon domain-containing protein [Leptolyngbya sp. KIOST-1]